jgi:membrane-bound metal-dependent hydrolase YbcI (DUF457 family)
MPLPLGHTAIGLAAYELSSNNNSALNRYKIFAFITILANLPDLDVIVGLVIKLNGNAFHRGPTHSIVFALIMGFLASRAWKFSSQIPRMNFVTCSLIILSHVLGDFFLTNSPISFFWPFKVSWSPGHSSLYDVLNSIFFQGFQNAGIIIGSAISIILIRLIKGYRSGRLHTRSR